MGQLTETCKLLKLLSDCYWVGPFSNERVPICILKILLAKNLTESSFFFQFYEYDDDSSFISGER